MNKSQIKNAVIVLLLLINLFLVANLVMTRLTTGRIPQAARESFVKVLADKNITIDISHVPERYEVRRDVAVSFYSIDNLRDMFLKNDADYVSDGKSIIATTDDKKLTVSGKRFEYSTLHESVAKDGKAIVKALKKQGLSTVGSYFDPADGLVKVKIDGALVENVYLDVKLDKNGSIAYAAGVWPKVTLSDSKKRSTLTSTIGDMIKRIPSGSVIETIYPVYSMDPREGYAHLIPAWRVVVGGIVYTVKE